MTHPDILLRVLQQMARVFHVTVTEPARAGGATGTPAAPLRDDNRPPAPSGGNPT